MGRKGNFSYQRADRRAALAVLAVAAACVAMVVALGGGVAGVAEAPAADSSASARADSASYRRPGPRRYTYAVAERRAELFAFDPNTADSTALLRLGLQPWQVRNIYKYRAAGGVYRRKEDFARLYGLTVGQYRRLEPYIRISPDFLPAATLVADTGRRRDTLRYPVKLRPGERIPLDRADTAALMRVPGIGRYYARAILGYGRRLGGYVSVAQLAEIEGFPEEAMGYFTIADTAPRRLNLNTLSLAQMRRHPYINFYQAKAIVDYRRQHGPLKGLADLRLCPDFTPEAIARLTPYVEF